MFSMYFILGNLPLPRRLMNSNRCKEEPGQTVQEGAPLKADMGKNNRWMEMEQGIFKPYAQPRVGTRG